MVFHIGYGNVQGSHIETIARQNPFYKNPPRCSTGDCHLCVTFVKGEPSTTAGIPESFNVLVQELRGLALDMTIYDMKGKQIPLTERDEDLITKSGSNF